MYEMTCWVITDVFSLKKLKACAEGSLMYAQNDEM